MLKHPRFHHQCPAMSSTYLGRVNVLPRATEVQKMCDSDRVENSRNNEESCIACGEQITEEGDAYLHCIACGLQVISLGYDTGYTYPSEVQGLRRTNSISSLGSQITRDGSSLSRRLSSLQDRISHQELSYVEKIVAEAARAGVSGRTLSALEAVLNISNSDNKLSTNRDKLKGSKGLKSRLLKSEYKIRLFAVAVLTLLNRKLYPSNVLQIQENWNLHKDDIFQETKFITRQLISNDYTIPVNSSYLDECSPVELRRNELSFHLDSFRDHLASYIDYEEVKEIIHEAINILSLNGEPIDDFSSSTMDGKFRNRNSQAAALLSIVESMITLGFDNRDIQELHRKNPVKGMKTLFSRLGPYRQKLAEDI